MNDVVPQTDAYTTADLLMSEHLLPLRQVPKELPPGRDGKRMHIATPFRWAGRGMKGHRLETIRIGGVVHTSREALTRFFAKLADPSTPAPSTAIRTSAARERAIAQAEAELAAAGI